MLFLFFFNIYYLSFLRKHLAQSQHHIFTQWYRSNLRLLGSYYGYLVLPLYLRGRYSDHVDLTLIVIKLNQGPSLLEPLEDVYPHPLLVLSQLHVEPMP